LKNHFCHLNAPIQASWTADVQDDAVYLPLIRSARPAISCPVGTPPSFGTDFPQAVMHIMFCGYS